MLKLHEGVLTIFGFNTCSDIIMKRCNIISKEVQFPLLLNISGSVFYQLSELQYWENHSISDALAS